MDLLLSQGVAVHGQHAASGSPAVTMVLAMLFVGFVVLAMPVAGIYRAWQAASRQRSENLMRMLEAGHPVTLPDPSAWPKAIVCLGIGLGVPVAIFAISHAASLDIHVPAGIWIGATLVSLAAVIASTLLAARLFHPDSRASRHSIVDGLAMGKGVADPDAYDVVGTRA